MVIVTVQPGDSLYAIAQQYMGNGNDWPRLYAANRRVVGPDPNLIYAGQQLRVPFGVSAATVAPARQSASSGGSVSVSVEGSGPSCLAVAQFLVQHGYTKIAAAGVAGDVYGESGCNPESVGDGGGGLIGWTPISSAGPDQPIITGNPAADFVTQLNDMLAYNEQYSAYLPALNDAADVSAAGYIYSADFERPAVTCSDCNPGLAQEILGQLG